MQPLKITAELANFRLSSIEKSLPLDGPLAWARIREMDIDRAYNASYGSPDWIDVDISDALKLVKMRSESFYACSWAVFKPLKEYITYRYRRFNSLLAETYVDFGKKRGKVITTGGTFKTWRIPLNVICVESLTWFCVGDPDRINGLLKSINYIGSARAAGYGCVDCWKIEPWPYDWSIYGPGGQLMRAIPSPEGDSICAIKYPYWGTREVRCITPNFSDELIEVLLS